MKDNLNTESVDSQLHTRYRLQATEQPSEQLDDKVIAQAKAAIANHNKDNVVKPRADFWRQYRWPISSAASVMLVVTLLLVNPEIHDELLSDDAAMPQSAPLLMQEDEPAMMRRAGQSEQSGNADLSVDMPVIVESTSGPNAKEVSMANGVDDHHRSATIEMMKSDDPVLAKNNSQNKAIISDLQAVNHLSQLVSSQQWSEAIILSQKMAEERPQLNHVQHPQHLQWSKLLKAIAQHK